MDQPLEVPGGSGEEIELGLRERKKAQTRQALIDAAWELFAERGYTATTIDDIAERVDVSSRTFFRYFPSKEAVVFADADERSEVVAKALADRPEGEPVLESIRHALHALADELAGDDDRAVLLGELCREVPALDQYRHNTGGHHAEEALLLFLSQRLDDDMAPPVIAGALKGAILAAWDHWLESGQELDMANLLDRAVDALEEGFRV